MRGGSLTWCKTDEKMKRIFSSLLIVMMLFSLVCVNVSAAEVYTITLEGTDGDTYDAYMIFSATSTGEGENEKIGYTLNPDFAGYFTEEFLADKGKNSAVEYVSSLSTASDIDAFAESIMNYAIANDSISPAGSGKTAIQVPSKGYYLIVEETSIYEARSLAMLEVTTKSETVSVKSSAPTLIMKVYDDDSDSYIDIADISFDETIEYKLTGSISAMKGYTQYTYTMDIEMEEGIDFNRIEEVIYKDSSGSTVPAPSNILYDVTEGTNSATITFSGMKNAIANGITSVEVIYSATPVTEDFVLRNGNTGAGGVHSRAKLTYSSDPYNTGATNSTAWDDTMVYSYSMSIHKVDANNEEEYLSGASFVIYSDAANTKPVYLKEKTANVYEVVTSETAGAVTEITTGATGILTILGLDNATWYVKETQAPTGYNPLLGNVRADINVSYKQDGVAKDDSFLITDRQNLAVITSSFAVEDETSDMPGNVKVTVQNSVGGSLPQTGGSGTMPFKVYGLSILVLACGVLLFLNRSKDKKVNN